MKKVIVLVLVISFILIIPGALEARSKLGAQLIIMKTDGQAIMGYLVGVKVKQKTLFLMGETLEPDVMVKIPDVDAIIIRKKSKTFLGFFAGCVTGVLLGKAVHDTGVYFPSESAGVLMVCPILGAGFGYIAGRDRKIQIAGKSEAEIEDILEKLRKKARITDYN